MNNLDFGDAKSLLLSLRQIETGGLVAGQNNLGFPSSSSTTRKLGNTRAGGGRVVERSLPKKNRPVHDAMDNAENSDLGRTHPTSKRSVVDVMMDSEGSSAADTPYHHPGQLVRGTSTSSNSGAIQVFPEHISTKKKTASYLVQPNADGGVALLKAKTSPFVLHDDLAKMSLQQYQQQQQHQQMQQLQQLQIQQQQQQVLLQQQLQQMRQQPPQLTQPPMMMTSSVTSHGTPHYINPPRAVQQEQEKLTGNLRVDMLQLQHSLAKNSKTVDKSIASTIKFLPVFMLNDKNNPVKIRQRNAALARALLIYRPYHARLMLRKLTHWWKVITEQKEALAAEKIRVAQHVREQAEIALGNFARFYRGFIARRRVRTLRKERQIELELGRERFERERMAEEEVLTRRTSTRTVMRACVMMQSHVRKTLAKNHLRLIQFRRANEAALCITLCLRRYILQQRRDKIALRKRLVKERKAAILIQSTVRRHLSHIIVAKQRTIYHRHQYLKVFDDDEKVIEFYFTQNGAALRIQRWFRDLPWRQDLALQRKHSKWLIRHPQPVIEVVRPKSALGTARAALVGLSAGLTAMTSILSRPVTPEGMFSSMSKAMNAAQSMTGKAFTSMLGKRYTEEEINRAAALITRIGKGHAARSRVRRIRKEIALLNALVTKIQCFIRQFLSRCRLAFRVRLRFFGPKAARVIQKIWWRTLFKKHAYHNLRRKRFEDERHLVGLSNLQKTLHYQHIDFMWSGAKKVRQTDAPQLELQRFFSQYASQGMLDVSGLLKLVKECPDLLDKKRFDAKMVELQFSKVKDVKEKRLSYARFIELVATLAAIKFLNIDPTVIGSYTGTLDPFATDTYAYKHLHIAGRGGYKSKATDSIGSPMGKQGSGIHAKGDKNSEVFEDKRPNTSSTNVRVGGSGGPGPDQLALAAEAVPVKPHTSHTTKRSTEILPGGKDVSAGHDFEIEKEKRARENSTSPARRQNSAKIANDASRNSAEQKISAFRYGHTTGRVALLVKFVQVYFHPLEAFRRIAQELDTPTAKRGAVSCLSLAREDVERQGQRIQAFCHHRWGMKFMNRYLASRAAAKRNLELYHAAVVIQRRMRGVLGRKKGLRAAQEMYRKFIDLELGEPYWFNGRSKASFWTKPPLLRHLDCGFPVQLAQPDEQFIVACETCNARPPSQHCMDCNSAYCVPCFEECHRGGKRKDHKTFHMPPCISCGYQMGTKFCLQCRESYCDTCFAYMHRKGRLAIHSFERAVPLCNNCKTRSAQWRRLYPEEDRYYLEATFGEESERTIESFKSGFKFKFKKTLKLLCTVCHKEKFGEPDPHPDPIWNPEGAARPMVEKIPYYGLEGSKAVAKKLRDDYLSQLRHDSHEAYQAKLPYLQHTSAIKIQKVYRGRYSRRKYKDFVAQRKLFLKARHEEDYIRNSSYHYLAELLGIAPNLATDTPYERILKKYPKYAHVVIAECLDYKWKLACEMEREQFEHEDRQAKTLSTNLFVRLLYNKPKRRFEGLMADQALKRAQASLALAEEKLNDTKVALRHAMDALHELKTASKVAVSEMKLLRFEKSVETAQEQVIKAETHLLLRQDELKAAENKVYENNGPRRLEKQIRTRREKGQLLPFTVDVYRGRALALTRFPRPKSPSKSNKGDPAGESRKNTNPWGQEDFGESVSALPWSQSPSQEVSLVNSRSVTFNDQIDDGQQGQGFPPPRPGTADSERPPTGSQNLGGVPAGSTPKKGKKGSVKKGPPDDWRTYLDPGDTVYIRGTHFKIVEKPVLTEEALDLELREMQMFIQNRFKSIEAKRKAAKGRKGPVDEDEKKKKTKKKKKAKIDDELYQDGVFESSVYRAAVDIGGARKKKPTGANAQKQLDKLLESQQMLAGVSVSDQGETKENNQLDENGVPTGRNNATKSKDGEGDSDEDDDDSDDGDSDDSDDSAEILQSKKFTKVVHTPQHLTLDHPWTMLDAKGVRVYKAAPNPPLFRAVHVGARLVMHSYPVQKFIAMAALSQHAFAQAMWILADQFDPDSPSGHVLRARATALEKGRDSFFRVSRTVVPVPSFRSLQKWIRRQSREAMTGARAAYKTFMTQVLKIDLAMKKSPFATWEESKTKDRVSVMVQMETKGFRPEQTSIGIVEIDLNAPVDVMRLYMHRYYRAVLNEAVGDAFLFLIPLEEGAEETGEANLLKREAESINYSSIVATFQMDARTMEGGFKVVLVKDPDTPFVPIEQADSEVDQDALDEAGEAMTAEQALAKLGELGDMAALGRNKFLQAAGMEDFIADELADADYEDEMLQFKDEAAALDFSDPDNVDWAMDKLSGGGSLAHLSLDGVPGRKKKEKKVRMIDKLKGDATGELAINATKKKKVTKTTAVDSETESGNARRAREKQELADG